MNYPLTFTMAQLELRSTRGYSPEYLVHQLVADLVPDTDQRGYLYRVTQRSSGEATVLILSDQPPVPSPPTRPWGGTQRHQSKPFNPQVSPGTELDYEIRLNATRTVTYPDKTKKRKDVWDAVFEADRDDPRSPNDVYEEYLIRKLDTAAEILDARVTERGQVRARRADHRHPIVFIATNLIGTLRIQDPERFKDLLAAGIGRAKAFGCGLLCLSRPGTVLTRRRTGVVGPR